MNKIVEIAISGSIEFGRSMAHKHHPTPLSGGDRKALGIVGVVGLDSKAVGCALSSSAQQILILEDVGRATTFQFLDP
jgi:hypothetical protein